MPPATTIEIVPEGLDQKTDAVHRVPGKLDRATNVEIDKTGTLEIRRGYSRQPIGTPIGNRGTVDAVFQDVGTYDDELVAFGYDSLYALGSRSAQLGGSARWIYRGPLNRGTMRLQPVAVSALSDRHQVDTTSAPGAAFAGFDQADVASLQSDGHTFRCYVWRNQAENRIEAQCFVELEHGQDVVVFRNSVAASPGLEATSQRVDCPKIIAVGSTFVVHWLQATFTGETISGFNLHRATLDMTTIDASTSWAPQGSIATHVDALYDAQPVEGSTTEFVVVHKWTSGTDVQVRRQNGFGWGATAWAQLAAVTIAARVLCCSASSTDDEVRFSYQRTGGSAGQLWTGRVLWSTGLGFLQVDTMTPAPFDEWGQVAHVRLTAGVYVVVAEGWGTEDTPSTSHHGVAYARLLNSAVAGSDVHWVRNAAMWSRPFAYQSARSLVTNDPNVYVGLSWKSTGLNPTASPINSWAQRVGWIVCLDENWWDDVDGSQPRVRPRIVATIGADGSFDARVSGWSPSPGATAVLFGKRMNHVSSVSGAPIVGPDVKSRTIAACTWNRITTRRVTDTVFDAGTDTVAELIPTAAGVTGVRFYFEDPWVRYRDASDPAEPSGNFRGAYPWVQVGHAQAGRSLVIAGGTPHTYDGQAIVELGFPHYPEIVEISAAAGSGGLEDGARWWTATYEWRDRAGQVHRSRPAKPVRLLVTAPNDNVTVTVRCCNWSLRDNPLHYPNASPISIVLWRTEIDGNTFYRVHGSDAVGYRIEDTPVNDPEAWQIEILDARPDLSAGEINLARSDLLPYNFAAGVSSSFLPIAPPACCALSIHQNRVFLSSSEDPRELWYSAEILPAPGDTFTVAPEFHFENRYTLPELGEVVAHHALDDELVLWTRDAIARLVGVGNSLGSANASYQLGVVHRGTGCTNPRSIVLAPPGLFFQSAKGLYMYGRNRELDYLGAGVEDDLRTAGTIRGGVLLEGRHQIRFSGNAAPTGAPRVWIFDYLHGLWTRADLTSAWTDARSCAINGSCAWRGAEGEELHAIATQGGVIVERASTDASPYSDENAAGASVGYPIDVRLAWLQLGGSVGLHRVREIGVLVEKLAAGSLLFDVAYDLDGTYDETADQTFTLASPAASFMRAKLAVQKATALLWRIYEPSNPTPGRRVRLRAFMLYAVGKPQPRRTPRSQTGT